MSAEATKNIPVVFFSGNINIAQLSKEAQADCYLQKPFDIAELEILIEQMSARNDAGV